MSFWQRHHVLSDFDSWILLKALCSKVMARNYLFAALALSALRRLRVHADLLDGTAFKAFPLVVCSKGPMYVQKSVDISLHPSSWG